MRGEAATSASQIAATQSANRRATAKLILARDRTRKTVGRAKNAGSKKPMVIRALANTWAAIVNNSGPCARHVSQAFLRLKAAATEFLNRMTHRAPTAKAYEPAAMPSVAIAPTTVLIEVARENSTANSVFDIA